MHHHPQGRGDRCFVLWVIADWRCHPCTEIMSYFWLLWTLPRNTNGFYHSSIGAILLNATPREGIALLCRDGTDRRNHKWSADLGYPLEHLPSPTSRRFAIRLVRSGQVKTYDDALRILRG